MYLAVILLILILITSTIYLFGILWKRINLLNKLSWIPGPTALPILGNYSELATTTPEGAFNDMKKYYKKYGKTHIIWIGTRPLILCQDKEIIQYVFKQEEKTRRPLMYVYTGQYLGPGLLMGEADEKWRLHRRYLSDSFHNDLVEHNMQLTVKNINRLIDIFDKLIKITPNKPIDLIAYTKPSFFDISLSAIAGEESNALEKPESCPYLDAIERMSEIVMARLFSPLLKLNFVFNLTPFKKKDIEVKRIIKSFIKMIIRQRKSLTKENDSKSGKHQILADAMITMEKKKELFTQEDVEDHVSNNLLAAYDTLSTISSFLLFILGNNEQIQDEVVSEIDSVAPNLLTDGISLKELNNMKLLDRCLKEALRMFPAAPMIGRHLIEPFSTAQGTLPAGVDVYINLYNYHRDEEVYPNAEVFDPDRWLPENSKERHPLSWIPFGLGVRSCIGQKTAMQQSKTAVAMMLKKFSFKSYERIEDLKLSANLVLKSQNGIRVYIKPRKTK